MSKIKQIIHNELSGVLPVHLARDIAQRIAKAIVREYGRGDCSDEEGVGAVQEHL